MRGKSFLFRTLVATIMTGLVIEVIILGLQNRELKLAVDALSRGGLPETLKPGERVQPFSATTMHGDTVHIEFTDTTSRFLFLVLSVGCPHCEKNLPLWNLIAKQKTDESLDVIGVSMNGPRETIDYVASKGIGFYTICSPDSAFKAGYKISGVPQSILIKSPGIVEKVWRGELSDEDIGELKKATGAKVALAIQSPE